MTEASTIDAVKFWTIIACYKDLDKQHRPRSDCFWRSSLIRVFPVWYPDQRFVNSNLDNQHFMLKQKEESGQNFRTFTVYYFYCRNWLYHGTELRFPRELWYIFRHSGWTRRLEIAYMTLVLDRIHRWLGSVTSKVSSLLSHNRRVVEYTGFTQAWKVLEFRGLSWKVFEN